MDYRKLLDDGYAEYERDCCGDVSKSAYLSLYIFDFTTYDLDMDELMAKKALEVCRVITERSNREYIADPENYRWYIIMCNMPFFSRRLDWGTSIRGAWWSPEQPEFASCGLWDGDRQVTEPLVFDDGEWVRFMTTLLEFSAEPTAPAADSA
ncbi:hypothetical protein [Achromobacter sp. UBA4530]|uniref:hypothetical protein n=1 Tax=Achromobacter sp. UBA4530 TaxID=1945912 RepID=UPI00257E3C6D|nr:hypothetical protein [Achromobacter sp. UBA4530]